MQSLLLGGIMDIGLQTLSDRTTIVDNATLSDWQIKKDGLFINYNS